MLTSDVARTLNVSSDAVRQWARTGRLTATQTLGGTRLFRREDVERFRRERAQKAAQKREAAHA